MKQLIIIPILLLYVGCATYTAHTNLRTFDVDASLTNPSDYTIAVLPTKPIGNPEITSISYLELTQKFESGLRKIGFKVIDAYFVNEKMVELGINSEEELSLVNMKKLQKELNCSAFCMTTITYDYDPEGHGHKGLFSHAVPHTHSKTSKAVYYGLSETFKIIEPSLFTTLVSIRIKGTLMAARRSMSGEMIFLLEEHFNKPDSTQSK